MPVKEICLDKADGEGAVWGGCPFQVVSLLDMREYRLLWVQNIALLVVDLVDNVIGSVSSDDRPKDTNNISPEYATKFSEKLGHWEQHLKYLGLKESIKYVNTIRGKLSKGSYTYIDYEKDIEILQGRVDHEMEDIVFGFIPADKALYFQNKALFGAKVNSSFPSAAKDIEEAGNCYAHGNYTGCVFHLMRALEHPLRALAIKLKVPPPKRNPKTPLELRTWGSVITAIITAINNRPNPKTNAEAKLTEFYNKAADQFQFFKDAWRDVVMHTRSKPYGEGEVKDLIKSVETFMQRVSDRLKEKPHSH